MLAMKRVWIFVFLWFSLNLAESVTKTWKFTNDILSPINWEGGKPASNCKGIIFPETLGSIGSVFDLYTEEITLPINGELEIRQGGFIQFSGNSICLRIKTLQRHHWLNIESWNHSTNAAIPDVEKVPCTYDDVVFPAEGTVAVFYPEMTTYVNSIEIGGVKLSDEQWQNFLQTDYGGEQFVYSVDYETGINIAPRECMSKSGCSCHFSDDEFYWVCANLGRRKDAPCLDPLQPVGHCSQICGGLLFLEVSNNFILEDFKTKMPKHEKIDTYASKVLKDGKHVIQVVFVEKEDYSELSVDVAKDFHSAISKDLKSFGVSAATLEISGLRIPRGSQWATAFSIIFGTFVAVSLIFAFVYISYMGPLENYNLRSRIPFREISFRNLRPFLFAKFENKEEGQMSMAASMMSLEKAFDNPMYGAHRPSTSSVAVDVVALTETQPSTSEQTHENPTYDEMKSGEVEIEDVEDSED